ncbi:hypothetical protein C8R45DRAFT_1221671 [Mycena sanguinolenta]|nr:hypothetical protein C8R45DRAFT_1221671 [Mycena sanguinolenta]
MPPALTCASACGESAQGYDEREDEGDLGYECPERRLRARIFEQADKNEAFPYVRPLVNATATATADERVGTSYSAVLLVNATPQTRRGLPTPTPQTKE